METLIQKVIDKTTQSLQEPKTSQAHCKIVPLSFKAVYDMLTNAYMQEVTLRGKALVIGEDFSQHLRQVSTWLTYQGCKPMLMLGGGVGNGKTTMAKAIKRMLKELKEQIGKHQSGDFWWKATPEDRKALDRLNGQLTIPNFYVAQEIVNQVTDDAFIQNIIDYPFVIIDDFGCEPSAVKSYGTEVTPIADILYARYAAMRPTILTTNLTMSEIAETYGIRIADRFLEVFETIGYTHQSYRSNK